MLTLSADHSARMQIVLPANPSTGERRAAQLLVEHLGTWTGGEIAVVSDDAPAAEQEILVGMSRRTADLDVDIDASDLGADGFTLRTVDGRLVIVGGAEKGPVYGAVAFLEDHLGFRLFAPGALVAPAGERFVIPDGLRDTQIPAIEFREDFYLLARDPQYAEWHRLDRHVEEWGMWVHTFARLIPPEDHFEAHPEWYSEVGGKRIPNGQLCLTNDELFHVLVDSLRRRVEAEPDKHYWSVSQNDTQGFCTCDRCAAIDAAEGAHSGSLLAFINRVAAEFPDRTISTLAYQYSRKAPAHIRPADNVLVVLAPIELNRSRPVATDPTAASFREQLEAWARITDRLLIWDYVIQFANLVSPFPNLRVLQPNLRYFVDNSAVAHFQQGNREVGGEWAELRAYLIAKLLWNPDADVEALIDDFLSGYYGAAAPHLRAYIDTQHDALEVSGAGLGIFGNPIAASSTYLTPELMDRYEAQLDAAEAAVADQPTHLERVRWARLPLHYAWLEQAKTRATGDRGLFERNGDGTYTPRPEVLQRLDHFVTTANEQGVTRVTEWHTTPDEYRERYGEVLERVPLDHLARGRPVNLVPEPSSKYPADGPATLTDGLRGPVNHSFGWLGWEGEDMEATVDLGRMQPVYSVQSDYLQAVGSWIWMPLEVEVFLSEDGEHFDSVGTAQTAASERQGGVFVETFRVETDGRPARYVRLRALSRKVCPDWHGGAGGRAWIFADEIVIGGGV